MCARACGGFFAKHLRSVVSLNSSLLETQKPAPTLLLVGPHTVEAAVTPIIQVIARSQGDGKTTSKVVELPENSHIVVISLVDLTPNTEYTVTGRILFQTCVNPSLCLSCVVVFI